MPSASKLSNVSRELATRIEMLDAVKFEPTTILTAMTFNAANGLALPARLVELIAEQNADLVGIQELAENQAEAIERLLAPMYPYRELHPLGIPGKAVLSKYPISATELLNLYPNRPDLQTTIDVNGEPLKVIVAHPPPPRFKRRGLVVDLETREQIARLLETANLGGPTLLMGDFNVIFLHRIYRQIAASGLVDVFRVAGRGPGYTLPTRMANLAYKSHPVGNVRILPVLRVDYLWITPDIEPLESWVGPYSGSDHLPVLARLSIRDQRV
jgi:endonuclease/exonuclease/phosphatase (EEP) superfamily protein YafD